MQVDDLLREDDPIAAVVTAVIKSVTATLAARISVLEERVKTLAAIPAIAGRDGRDGLPGPPGPPGEKGLDGRDGANGIDGKDGIDGVDGTSGRDGVDGKDGRDGVDGTSGRDGVDGKDGRDGVDGLGFDDVNETLDIDGRTLVRVFRSGDRSKEFRHTFAALLDRGVYQDTREYEPGDAVTWAGSIWIAQHGSIGVKPDEGSTMGRHAWRLAVKRGREGRPGPKGDPGAPGAKGEKGDRGPERW
jgi:collagen type III alpha